MGKISLIVTTLLVIVYTGVIVYQSNAIDELENKNNLLEIQNDRLKDENTSLTDQIWNLNNKLMESESNDIDVIQQQNNRYCKLLRQVKEYSRKYNENNSDIIYSMVADELEEGNK